MNVAFFTNNLIISSGMFVNAWGPPFNIQGGGGWSFCRGQIIYFNPTRRRAENFKLYYMFI